MKNSSHIISHLKNQPLYSKLKTIKCYEKIKSLLPKRLQQAILFIYIKNNILFFALNHPGYKMEFNYNVNFIKSALKELKNRDQVCKDFNFTDIKVFVSNKISNFTDTHKQENKPIYKERAKGDFEIRCDNENLKQIFLRIQNIIKEKHQNYGS